MKNLFTRFYSIRVKVMVTFFLALMPVYILGFSLFRWGYEKLTVQIEAAQLAQVRLYADSLNSEFRRIQNLQYECVNDEDLLYLVNAYPILNPFEKSQYLLRAQRRLQIMKNSSTCIKSITVHLPAIDKSISNSGVMPLDADWEIISDMASTSDNGIIFSDNQIQIIIQYPVLPRKGRIPRIIMEITLSNEKICSILDGFTDYPGNELVLRSADGNYYLSNLDHVTNQLHHSKDIYEDEMDIHETTVLLESANLELISIVPRAQLFAFTQTYLSTFAAFTIVSIIVIIVFAFSIRHMVHKPIQTLVDAFSNIKERYFDTRIQQIRNDEFQYLYKSFNETMDYLQELIEKMYEQKLLTQRAELKQLQSQINPHFLYNSFHNIYRMAKSEGSETISKFTSLLSEYYQYITRNAADEASVEKEIHHAQVYLNIQSIRFGQRLRISIAAIPETLKKIPIPRLTVQPLLENAFEHGIQNVDEPFISLAFHEDKYFHYIVVEDNGPGLPKDELDALTQKLSSTESRIETTAIINIHRRLILRYGSNSGLSISNSDVGGFRIQLQIPKEAMSNV